MRFAGHALRLVSPGSDNDYGNWDRKKAGSRIAMFTWTRVSIVRTRHSQFIKSDASAALRNH